MRFQVLWKILYLILMELGIRSLIIHEDGTEYQSDSDSPDTLEASSEVTTAVTALVAAAALA